MLGLRCQISTLALPKSLSHIPIMHRDARNRGFETKPASRGTCLPMFLHVEQIVHLTTADVL